MPVKVSEGKVLKLGDVAKVVENHPPLIGDAIVNDDTGLVLVVEKFPGANTVAVTRAVEGALAELRLGLPGVQLDSSLFRLSSFIEASMENIGWAALVGAAALLARLLAAVARGADRADHRAAEPARRRARALPAGHDHQHDGAGRPPRRARCDHRRRRRRYREHHAPPARKSPAGAPQVQRGRDPRCLPRDAQPAPLRHADRAPGGHAGDVHRRRLGRVLQAARRVLCAGDPGVDGRGARRRPGARLRSHQGKAVERREPALVRALQNGYEGPWTTSRDGLALGVAALVAITGLALWPHLRWSQTPAFKERDLLITWEAAPGTSQTEMQRITGRASRELRAIPGVKTVGAHVGRAITGDQVVGLSSSQLWVSLDRKAAYDATVAAIQQTVDGYPGVHARVHSYLRKTASEVLTGAPHPIVVRIYGAEREILRHKAGGGAAGPLQDRRRRRSARRERDRGAAHPGQGRRRRGGPAGPQARRRPPVRGDRVLRHRGRLPLRRAEGLRGRRLERPEKRHSIDSIRDHLIETPNGDHVRLAGIADVGIKPTPAVIQREAISNFVDVTAGLQGPDLASVSREIERRLQEVRFPLEYHPELLGEYSERQSAQSRALIVAAIAAIGIFLLLQACFESWLLAAVVLAALPAALMGGVLAAYAAGHAHRRLAGRVARGARDHGPQQHRPDQALPAPRAAGEPAVRPGADAARGP